MEDKNNEIIELSNVSEDTLYEDDIITDIKDDEIVIKNKNPKKFSWSNLSKVTKILIIAIPCGLIVIALVLSFVLFNKKGKENTVDNVIVEKDNYTYENGFLNIFSDDEKELGKYECVTKDSTKCYIAKLSNEDKTDLPIYQNSDKEVIEKNSKIYLDRYVFIKDEGKVLLYDLKDSKVLESFITIKMGSVNNLVVYKDALNKYGIISFKDDKYEVILKDYEFLSIINSEDIFVAKENNKSYLVDTEGKVLSSKVNGEITNFSKKYISVRNSSYTLYDYKGLKLYDELDFITFVDEIIYAVKDDRLYIFDDDYNKLNEAGIKLKSKDYVPINILDKDNKVTETKSAFSIESTDGKVVITLSDKQTKEVNTYEGIINKSLSYVNYFDGVLYFYSDEAKKDLIGKYSCNNKNEVKSVNDTYENCMLAKDSKIVYESEGYIPIINEQYAFIFDTKTGANKTLNVLYDLVNNESSAKYLKVDTGLGDSKIGLISGTNMLIFAQSYQDNNYGAITFSQKGAESLIAFRVEDDGKKYSTKSINKFKEEYLLVKRENKNYLYDLKGTLMASSILDIVDFQDKYLLVKDSNKYQIYKMNSDGTSGTFASDKLDEIKFYKTFFAGVNNKELNLYAYDSGKDKMLETSVKLESGNYAVTFNGDKYVIEADGKTFEFNLNGKSIIDEEE